MFRDGLVDFHGDHIVELLSSGEAYFPSLIDALNLASEEVWLATYIFNDDTSGQRVADALVAAARRGVRVHVLVDGFGCKAWIPVLKTQFAETGVRFEVFRPLDRWWAWFQPQQLRRMHQKLVAVDERLAFVGGINLIDDRFDVHHGWSSEPRLDFAVRLDGPIARDVASTVRALWTRAHLGRDWLDEVISLFRTTRPLRSAMDLLRQLSTSVSGSGSAAPEGVLQLRPVRVGLVVRDNLRRRRTIEHAYVSAINRARYRIDIACPYFYPGTRFRRALERAASRGVEVRLLLQGKVDYRIAALAARVLYDDLLSRGVHIYEYTPAFLHAKVAAVDMRWATVGSSNIDPLSLLLNLEANVVVIDEPFVQDLTKRLEQAYRSSTEIMAPPLQKGWRSWLMRGFVAWAANAYLRMAGISGKY